MFLSKLKLDKLKKILAQDEEVDYGFHIEEKLVYGKLVKVKVYDKVKVPNQYTAEPKPISETDEEE